MWTEKARSWRKNKKRAVSPIIATILLVAITVVLAAVLYILISGLTKGPGNTPLGTAFNVGTPQNISTTTGTAPVGCTTGQYCYTMAIAEASGGVSANNIQVQVKTPTGGYVTVAKISVVSLSGSSITNSTDSGATWTVNSALSSTQSIVIDIAPATGVTGLTADTLVFLGVGSFSGQVTANLA